MTATSAAADPGRVGRAPFKRAPRSLLDLPGLFLKRFILGLLWQLPIAIGVGVLLWLFHTFVLVWVNEGFSPGGAGDTLNNLLWSLGVDLYSIPMGPTILALVSRMVDATLATPGRGTLSATVFWYLVTSLTFFVFFRMLRRGPFGFLRDVLGLPWWVRSSGAELDNPGGRRAMVLSGILMGLAIAIAVGAPTWIGNRGVVMVLALHAVALLAAHMNGLSPLVVRLGSMDLQRLAGRGPDPPPIATGWLVAATAGIALGLASGSVMPWLCCCGSSAALVAALGALAMLLMSRSGGRGTATVLTFLATAGTCLISATGLADDGGWQEAGGTFSSWVNSEGAMRAVAQGVPPALGAALGVLAGIAGGAGSTLAGAASVAAASVVPGKPLPTGYFSTGKPYWGDGSPDDPYTDIPPWERGKGIYGDGTADNPFTDSPADPIVPDAPDSPDPVVADPPKQDTPAKDSPSNDTPGGADSRADVPKADEPKPDEPRPDEPRPDEPRPDEPKPGEVSEAIEKAVKAKALAEAQLVDLNKKFQEKVEEKIGERHYVMNTGPLNKLWNWSAGQVVDWFQGNKGGQCGEYGPWGKQWSEPFVEEIYGEDAVVDTIFISEVSTDKSAGEQSYVDMCDSVFQLNHRATRVITPTGERFVIDYWDAIGVGEGKAKVVPEDVWIAKWRRAVGENDSHTNLSHTQGSFKDILVKAHQQGKTQEEGFEIFREYARKNKLPAETYINSWKKMPW